MNFSRIVLIFTLATASIVGLSCVPEAQQLFPQLLSINKATIDVWALLRPGGRWHPAGFIEHHGHLVVEGSLLLVIVYLLFQGTYKPAGKVMQPLTEKEVQQLCDEWEPAPLHSDLTEYQKLVLDAPIVDGTVGTHVTVNGSQVLNMVSMNFLGIAGMQPVKQACENTISKYGVGSCGPRGFYGTIDVHLQLEERLAKFMGTQETILYSYDLATLSSVIPAFANKKDLIIMDEACNYSIQNGCNLSRARVYRFKHNDVADLERLLKQVAADDRKYKRPLNRRFIIVEGIYINTGDMAPLKDILQLKEQYRYRLVVDESISFGVLGRTGRGAAEHFGGQPEDIEIVGASLGNAVASVGGFCAGEREIVDHQRLSGLGYCFSASLPPYLASAAIAAIDVIESDGPQLMAQVQSNAQSFRKLAASIPGLKVVGGDGVSPLVHLQLDVALSKDQYDAGDLYLQHLVESCLAKNVFFTVAKYSMLEPNRQPPSIRIAISAAHKAADIKLAVDVLKAAVKTVGKFRL